MDTTCRPPGETSSPDAVGDDSPGAYAEETFYSASGGDDYYSASQMDDILRQPEFAPLKEAYEEHRKNLMDSSCLENLKAMKAAKDLAAEDNNWPANMPVPIGGGEETVIIRSLGRDTMLTCPIGGEYSWNPVGRPPTCSIGGKHALPVSD